MSVTKEQAQALLDASRSAEGGSPWMTAYNGDYYVHNGYSRIVPSCFSEEVADLIAAAPDLARTVVEQAEVIERVRAALEAAPIVRTAGEAVMLAGQRLVTGRALSAALDGLA